jgi:hypothetical protein
MPEIPHVGRWIMVTQDIGVEDAPERFSIHWTYPWPGEFGRRQMEICQTCGGHNRDEIMGHCTCREFDLASDEEDYSLGTLGLEPNWLGARAIRRDGKEPVRIFPHEFSLLPDDRMREYIYGTDDRAETRSHELVPDDTLVAEMVRIDLDPDARLIRDAALIDGCTEPMAQQVAMLRNPIEESTFAPRGWYRILPHYAYMYGLKQTDEAWLSKWGFKWRGDDLYLNGKKFPMPRIKFVMKK